MDSIAILPNLFFVSVFCYNDLPNVAISPPNGDLLAGCRSATKKSKGAYGVRFSGQPHPKITRADAVHGGWFVNLHQTFETQALAFDSACEQTYTHKYTQW